MPPHRFVVCGDDPLAHSLVSELVGRYDAAVTVILPSRRANHGPQLAAIPGVRIVESERLDVDAFQAAELDQAGGLALVHQDDAGNIHAALLARELVSGIGLVIRMFSGSLGYAVRRLFSDCEVLADAKIAAPGLVAAARGEDTPGSVRVRIAGRTLYLARRSAVPRQHRIECGIVAPAPGVPVQLCAPDDQRTALVLVAAGAHEAPAVPDPDHPGEPAGVPGSEQPGELSGRVRWRVRWLGTGAWPRRWRVRWLGTGAWPGRWRLRRPAGAAWRGLISLVDTKLEIAALTLGAVFLGGVATVAIVDGINLWQAFYTTVIIAADAGDPDLEQGLLRQLVQATVAVAGIALVPVLTALVVSASVNARLAAVTGQLRRPMADHLVVVGLGNVGTRVIQQLHELGEQVVAIDKSESSRGAQLARELGIPLVVGDAGRGETLRRASVGSCRALLALSTSDVNNLGAALRGRGLQPGLRVVLRLFDDDFAGRVQGAFGIDTSRSVAALTAPYFAAALVGRQRVHTLAVQRDVLLVTELPVESGAPLDGAPIRSAGPPEQVRVLAVDVPGAARPIWQPPPDRPIQAGDRLYVIANQVGLTRVLARSAGPDAGAGLVFA